MSWQPAQCRCSIREPRASIPICMFGGRHNSGAPTGLRGDSPNRCRSSRVPHQASSVPRSRTKPTSPIGPRASVSRPSLTLFAISCCRGSAFTIRRSVDGHQIIDNPWNLLIGNVRAVDVFHLVDFTEPGRARERRLHGDVPRGMADDAGCRELLMTGTWRKQGFVMGQGDGMDRVLRLWTSDRRRIHTGDVVCCLPGCSRALSTSADERRKSHRQNDSSRVPRHGLLTPPSSRPARSHST